MNTFGARLRSLRKQKDLSQEQVAKYLGYSRVQVSNWEIERSEPDIQALGKLAEFYGVTVDYITGKVESPTDSLVPEKKQTPADTAGENIGEGVTLTSVRELTDVLVIENEGAITFMGVPLTRQDILDVRHTTAMIMRQRLPAIIPIYPPRPPRDYSKIISIKDIDPDMVPLPEEFINLRGERINRYEIYQAEGHAKTDEEWRNTVINHKYHLPPRK